ncbi:peroxide stress protein YaaA [Allosalinactinospora lopnorensis]|uniref:peroxide stress protein YaaA n=1 Tax=Allosalinactinospora lopnorensis TaxID=1352348 RepID=UPI000623EE0E|nr:peroxide stress protein YaaA [Allosalinactinospora lopnorensis]
MLILLPPSEGKATAGDGAPLDLAALSLPEMNEARETALEALEALCSGPEETARQVLRISAAQNEAVRRDREVRTAATLRAADLYTGMLYGNLRLPELLSGGSAELTRRSVLIFSGLWGAVGATDPLPPYRLSMGVRLPPIGALGTFWRSRLAEVLTKSADGQLVVDCRSSTYAAAFKPSGGTAERTATVRVLRETVSGGVAKRTVVSHMAKATRGALAHALLANRVDAGTPAELAEALNDLGHPAELTGPPGRNRPFVLDVVVRA